MKSEGFELGVNETRSVMFEVAGQELWIAMDALIRSRGFDPKDFDSLRVRHDPHSDYVSLERRSRRVHPEGKA